MVNLQSSDHDRTSRLQGPQSNKYIVRVIKIGKMFIDTTNVPWYSSILERKLSSIMYFTNIFSCYRQVFVRSTYSCINQPTIWQQIVHWITSLVQENSKLRTCWEHVVYMNCSECQNKNNLCTQHVLPMFSPYSQLAILKYWTCNSMNNFLSYCGLVGD